MSQRENGRGRGGVLGGLARRRRVALLTVLAILLQTFVGYVPRAAQYGGGTHGMPVLPLAEVCHPPANGPDRHHPAPQPDHPACPACSLLQMHGCFTLPCPVTVPVPASWFVAPATQPVAALPAGPFALPPPARAPPRIL